ncbi:UDP-N-acetylmuramoyl-tripeptide--D-alanyl-D-alanine ligase [Serpentinicella sp. ANB-PHB4]|uniref:UDP-N-acetylmuramoyl-tripeptide--D-alanyl-D- alanine ligase n=1 Tax=Serpentinicella sp. ANB-PHB4 TaxID=3074076 RepID=UPI0028587A80|nr:UDP-N-acetylmuramoyl-tripeptide--D-alanyl-D-alanine ligase [Serpentinicella sp. ANB-PHB4]MDR5658028.1 UDP-N-acetylmuramoyl-tripeptide--D-alanyl-D-alanine ligase [Serpentinicella sp. ANB-PHB4]
MIKQRIDNIYSKCEGTIITNPQTTILGISTDTRTIKPGEMFVALIGKNFDGHNYIEEAIKKGASAVCYEKGKYNPAENDTKSVSFIQVENTLANLQEISTYYRNLFDVPFVGVTGSTGKTTTKDMISHVLSHKYNTHKNEGNFNNEIGLPLTLLNLDKSHQYSVLEMGMSEKGEIENLAKIVEPNIAIITNIGLSHIENLGSKENIMSAKLEISTFLKQNDILLLNGDDELLKNYTPSNSFKTVFIGLSKENDFFAEEINTVNENGYEFDVEIGKHKYRFEIKQPGIHNVYNALFAIWVGIYAEMNPDEINTALSTFKPTRMRLELIKLPRYTIINDAYNANPDSMNAALNVLSGQKGNKKIAVLGNMFEMGEHAEYGHRMVGEYVIKNKIDTLITIGNMATWIADEAKKLGFDTNKIYETHSNDEAFKKIVEITNDDDVILLKGSRGMKMDEIATNLQERS